MQIIRVRNINSGGRTNGCEKAPVAVLDALKNIESNERGKLIEFEKLNLEEIHVNFEDIEEANHLIFENSRLAFERNFKTILIGGDHSIDYPIIKAFCKNEKNPLLIVFDAHADCKSGSGKIPMHEEWLHRLVEEGFDAGSVILVGTRDVGEEELEFIKKNKINIIKMDILQEDLAGICDLIMERARNSSGFYISIDIDCVDPAFAPGACDIEPGGLSSRELIYFIKRLSLLENFKGADIVEINPDKDVNEMTVKLGAKILGEMM